MMMMMTRVTAIKLMIRSLASLDYTVKAASLAHHSIVLIIIVIIIIFTNTSDLLIISIKKIIFIIIHIQMP